MSITASKSKLKEFRVLQYPDSSFFMYILGCDCTNIIIIVENNAKIYQSSSAGSYEVSEKTNGETTWVSYSKAIWFSGYDWVIGNLSDIGKNEGRIFSSGNNGIFSCPYDATNNIGYIDHDQDALVPDMNKDITIQCSSPLQGDTNREFCK